MHIIRSLLTDDPDATSKAMRDDGKIKDFMNMALKVLVQEIRSEFSELRRPTFRRWKAEKSFEEMDMSLAGKEVFRHAPNSTKLVTSLALNTRSGGNQGYSREEEGYVVMLTSILLLKSPRNTANRFAVAGIISSRDGPQGTRDRGAWRPRCHKMLAGLG